MNPIVISNATPLTSFALVGRPDLMLALWPRAICTTPDVWDEYLAGVAGGRLPAEAWKMLPVIQLSVEEENLMHTLSARLGKGERSCIAVAHQRGGLLVTDDLDARRIAKSLDVAITGSVGVLVASLRVRYIDLHTGNTLLAQMIAAGFHSPVSALDEFLKP